MYVTMPYIDPMGYMNKLSQPTVQEQIQPCLAICQVNVQALPLKFQIIENMIEAQIATENIARWLGCYLPSL